MTSFAEPRADGDPRFARLCLFATIAVLAANLAGLGTFPLLDVDEPRFVTASRNLFRGDDWIVPWFNGAERFDKPILIYWLQAAAMAVFGPHEFAGRLPSALAIAGVVPMVASIGRALGLRATFAVLAGVAVATCAVAQALARGATADALLLFLVAWTAKLQIDLFTGRGTARTLIAAWAVGALAFLAKGPPAIVAPVALAIGMFASGYRSRWRVELAGAALAIAIVLAWAIPALIRTDGRFWDVGVMHHVVDRSLQPFEGHGGHAPWWYLFYVVAIPLAFLPWSPFLLELFRGRGIAEGAPPRTARLLLLWAGLTFLVFTIATSKLAHYPLPGFPPLAIALMAAVQNATGRSTLISRVIGGILGTVGVLLAGVLVAAFVVLDLEIDPVVVFTAATFAVGLGAAARFSWRGDLALAATATAITAVAGFAQVGSAVAPLLLGNSLQRAVEEARTELFDPASRVLTYELSMPSLVFYLDRDVLAILPTAHQPSGARIALDRLAEPGTLIVLQKKRLGELRAALDAADHIPPAVAAAVRTALDTPRATLRGFSTNKGKPVELIVLGT